MVAAAMHGAARIAELYGCAHVLYGGAFACVRWFGVANAGVKVEQVRDEHLSVADQQIPCGLLPEAPQITSRSQPCGALAAKAISKVFRHLAQLRVIAANPGTAAASSITEHTLKHSIHGV
jgi:hypothetical protein